MIIYIHGDLFESPASTLVNTVNTVGVMGKGIAMRFKKSFPAMYEQYRNLCETGELSPGKLFLYRTASKNILNFPTKRHWRHPSRPEYIESGLKTFVAVYAEAGIDSIAFPALGCGNGELDFEGVVKPIMERYLQPLALLSFIYPPKPPTGLPEHRDVEATSEWLRSNPSELPFAEVWEDLVSLIGDGRNFETLSRGSAFVATVSDSPSGIRIGTSSRSEVVGQADLLEFWRKLRTLGFMSRMTAPENRVRQASYLIPIFAELPYVRPTAISENYESFIHSPEIALQLVPRRSNENPELQYQMSFSS